jgi:hypothetical protein
MKNAFSGMLRRAVLVRAVTLMMDALRSSETSGRTRATQFGDAVLLTFPCRLRRIRRVKLLSYDVIL